MLPSARRIEKLAALPCVRPVIAWEEVILAAKTTIPLVVEGEVPSYVFSKHRPVGMTVARGEEEQTGRFDRTGCDDDYLGSMFLFRR